MSKPQRIVGLRDPPKFDLRSFERKLNYLPTDVVMHIQTFLSVVLPMGDYQFNDPWTLEELKPTPLIPPPGFFTLGHFDLRDTDSRWYGAKKYLIDHYNKIGESIMEKQVEYLPCLQVEIHEVPVPDQFQILEYELSKTLCIASLADYFSVRTLPGVWHYVKMDCIYCPEEVWFYHIYGYERNPIRKCSYCEIAWSYIEKLINWINKKVFEQPWAPQMIEWFEDTNNKDHSMYSREILNVESGGAIIEKIAFFTSSFYLQSKESALIEYWNNSAELPNYAEICTHSLRRMYLPCTGLWHRCSQSMRVLDANAVLEKERFLELVTDVDINAEEIEEEKVGIMGKIDSLPSGDKLTHRQKVVVVKYLFSHLPDDPDEISEELLDVLEKFMDNVENKTLGYRKRLSPDQMAFLEDAVGAMLMWFRSLERLIHPYRPSMQNFL